MWSILRLQKYAFSTQLKCFGSGIESKCGRTNAIAKTTTAKLRTWAKILLMTRFWSYSLSTFETCKWGCTWDCCHGNGPMPVLHPSSIFFRFILQPFSVSYPWLWTSTWSHVLHKWWLRQLTSSSPAPASLLGSVFLHIRGHFTFVRARSCLIWAIMPGSLSESRHDKVWDGEGVQLAILVGGNGVNWTSTSSESWNDLEILPLWHWAVQHFWLPTH